MKLKNMLLRRQHTAGSSRFHRMNTSCFIPELKLASFLMFLPILPDLLPIYLRFIFLLLMLLMFSPRAWPAILPSQPAARMSLHPRNAFS